MPNSLLTGRRGTGVIADAEGDYVSEHPEPSRQVSGDAAAHDGDCVQYL
jgi:hypothetical protein